MADVQWPMVWIPVVPLPLMGWRTDRCMCGAKFRGRYRRELYELHYRSEHEDPDSPDQVCVTPAKAAAIYQAVAATSNPAISHIIDTEPPSDEEVAYFRQLHGVQSQERKP